MIRQGWLTLDNRDGERFPAALFDDALRLDSAASAAHAGKAVTFMLLNRLQDAEAEAAVAERLDPSSGAPYAVRGFMKMMYQWDWPGAGADLEKAVARGCPDVFCRQWYGWYLGFTGQFPLAVRETAGAVERNAGRLASRATYGQMLYWAGDNRGAVRELQTVVDAGGGATHARLHLWKAQLAAGDRKAASRNLLLAVEPAMYRLPDDDDLRTLESRNDLFGRPSSSSACLGSERKSRPTPTILRKSRWRLATRRRL